VFEGGCEQGGSIRYPTAPIKTVDRKTQEGDTTKNSQKSSANAKEGGNKVGTFYGAQSLKILALPRRLRIYKIYELSLEGFLEKVFFRRRLDGVRKEGKER